MGSVESMHSYKLASLMNDLRPRVGTCRPLALPDMLLPLLQI